MLTNFSEVKSKTAKVVVLFPRPRQKREIRHFHVVAVPCNITFNDNETQFNWNKTWLRIPTGWRLITVEISGRMRDMSKKVFKRKLISVLFEILKGKDDYLGATMITRKIKSRNPNP